MRFAMRMLVFGALATPATAGTKAGVTMPDQVTVGDKTLVLNGMGLREATILKVDVYVAGLYVEQPSSNPAQPVGARQVKRLDLRFVRDVGHDDIVEAWREGFRNNATVPVAQLQPLIDRLEGWMPSFHKGDTLTFTFLPEAGVAVDINGVRKGVLQGDAFAQSLLSIWLGPKPPGGGLKRGLLGDHRA